MAVESSLPPLEGQYGPLEPLTLPVLRVELEKLKGTLADDITMDYGRCLMICDGFIDELGTCLNLSSNKYPDDQGIYSLVFDGLQDVITLMHGIKEGLIGTDHQPRVMDDNESRGEATDRLNEIIDNLSEEISRRERLETLKHEPRRRPREVS